MSLRDDCYFDVEMWRSLLIGGINNRELHQGETLDDLGVTVTITILN
jgi:hypothetical protein